MPDGLAPQVIAMAGPLVFATFLEHYLTPKKRDAEGKRTAGSEDLMYDEAFEIGKTFLNIANDHTCASLQKFGATRTPAPPWVAIHRLLIPQQSLSQSADFLIKAFGGEEMAYKIAGGSKWWQVRAGHGVEAEWIVMKDEYRRSERERHRRQMRQETKRRSASPEKRAESEAPAVPLEGEDELDSGFIPEMDKLRCMLYIHGGAYYWGSINTHRYTIWRFARKMHGRCFAVNYRKAPQYPFPCAIQDILAAYLYLVNPPKDAPHRRVDPKEIIIAGDSAGGGLTWALLQILRDTPGLELPAGAVLISPWSDLTHSFPSILENTDTDVIPAYSFIHKPSSLWPPPPTQLTAEMQNNISIRVKEAVHKMRHRHQERDGESASGLFSTVKKVRRQSIHTSDPDASGRLHDLFAEKEKEKKSGQANSKGPHNQMCVNPSENFCHLEPRSMGAENSTLAQVGRGIQMDVYKEPVVVDTQIQLYCTNGQLCHPWISPILGYLGGLPPLYILAGDDEVLRDEIIYCAHKAARPNQYPLRDDVRDLLPSMKGIEEKHKPTEVHLQVFDGVGHDLTLFSMTKPARGAYRSIATFCRYVTPRAPGALPSEHSTPAGTPGTMTPGRGTQETMTADTVTYIDPSTPRAETGDPATPKRRTVQETHITTKPLVETPQSGLSQELSSPVDDSQMPSPSVITERLRQVKVEDKRQTSRFSRMSTIFWPSSTDGSPGESKSKDRAHHYGQGTCGWPGIYAGPNPFADGNMIRQRVDFSGNVRGLEPADQLPACTMPLSETGYIKEGPAMRYIEGQAKWDRKFHRVRKRVARHRKRNLKKAKDKDADRIRKNWVSAGENIKASLLDDPADDEHAHRDDGGEDDRDSTSGSSSASEAEEFPDGDDTDLLGSTWGWALNGEAPPPSAIVSRRDLPEGRNLALLGGMADSPASHSHPLSLWVVMATMLGGNGSELMSDAARIRADEKAKKKEREKVQAKEGKHQGEGPFRRFKHMFKSD